MTILVTEAKFFDLGNDALKQVLDLQAEDPSLIMPKNKWQRMIWCLFEHPETSRASHYLTLFSVLMIIFSVAILCIETLPELKVNPEKNKTSMIKTSGNKYSISIAMNDTNTQALTCKCVCNQNQKTKDGSNHTISSDSNMINWPDVFGICEAVFVGWFTLEFTFRFASSPSKIQFMKGFLNIIDIFSILPFYITIALNKHGGFGLENLRVVRLVRVFRIFKLSRHSKGLQILGETLHASMRELGLLIIVIAIGVILFSSAAYYLEPTNFESIPEAFWWSIITMCTVGYGDKVGY